jgi:hypothetical protein
MSKRASDQEVISARLMILQSKRLMLGSLERRLSRSNPDDLQIRAETLRREAAHALDMYRGSVLAYGSPSHADYWLVAYGRLIDMGNALTKKLREATVTLPPEERYEISADVEMLEFIVGAWTESMRTAMSESVA